MFRKRTRIIGLSGFVVLALCSAVCHITAQQVGKDCFNVDLEWPLSILQAFAICLSRFDTQAQF